MLTQHHLQLPPEPHSAGIARDFVVRMLDGSDRDRLDVAALLTSELVTNALLHARTDVTVTTAQLRDGCRVEVADASPLMPVQSHNPSDAVTGRGLGLVEALADSWGVARHGRGKTVWFELH